MADRSGDGGAEIDVLREARRTFPPAEEFQRKAHAAGDSLYREVDPSFVEKLDEKYADEA